jgi:hypothetical protein
MLGPEVSMTSDLHCILEYSCIQDIFQGWKPSLNTKFIYVSYRLYTHSLKIICTIFLVHLHFDSDLSHKVKCGTFYLLVLKKFHILEQFEFQLFRLEMLNLCFCSVSISCWLRALRKGNLACNPLPSNVENG